jgi:DNA-binding SARP family transcriptional activator/Flp pilus assembly protein TadD
LLDEVDALSLDGSSVQVSLFGTPRIERQGAAVHVDTRKAIALLAFLASSTGRQSREELAVLLWPEADASGARGSLRRTLSTLKSGLGDECIEADRDAILLRQDQVDVDVTRFCRNLSRIQDHAHSSVSHCADCVALLENMISLYTGDFLAGLSLRDSPEFDDWQAARSAAYRRDLAAALESATSAMVVARRFDDAERLAHRLLGLDQLNEGAHRLLMNVYSASGDRSAAIRQYHDCLKLLEQELAVPPIEETTRLYVSIKEGESERVDVGVPPPPTPSPFRQLPLVGRKKEWRELLSALDQVREGPRVVVLEGEAGIGKTRLLEDFLEHARARGAATLNARCFEGETDLAYSALTQLLRSAVDRYDLIGRHQDIAQHDLAEAARLLPELDASAPTPSLPALSASERTIAHTRFLDGVSRVLLLAGPFLVLAVDDLQWADAASLECLAYLLRRIEGRRVCVVLAWRDEDADRVDEFRKYVAGARRTNRLTDIALQRLDQGDVETLVKSVGPRPITTTSDEQVARWLYQESEGVPFVLGEYLTALDQGAVDRSLPRGVRDLLASRVSLVSETAAQFLTSAAVIGRSFDFATLSSVSGRNEEMTVSALDELQSKGFVRELPGELGPGPAYDFRHDKLRDLVYERTSLARRRLLHKRAAAALLSTMNSGDDSQAGQVAHHYRESGMRSQAADYSLRAGDYAARVFANREAVFHYENAVELGHPEQAILHELVGDLHVLLGEYPAAVSRYEAADALLKGTGKAELDRKLGATYDRWGAPEPAEQYYARALELLGEDNPTERARVYSGWSMAVYHRGDVRRALDLAQRAYELAINGNDVRSLAVACNMLGVLEGNLDKPKEAEEHLKAGVDLARDGSDSSVTLSALQNLALLHNRQGKYESARLLTLDALSLAVSFGDRHREAALHNTMADILHASEASEEAMNHLKQAVAIYAEIGVEAGELRPETWMLTEW